MNNLNVITPEKSPFARLSERIGEPILKISKAIVALFLAVVFIIGVPAAVIKILFYM